MNKVPTLGAWIRRFLMEYLVNERNLARNTQESYRDTLRLLVPLAAQDARKRLARSRVLEHNQRLRRSRPGNESQCLGQL
jgi:hypothetical protein